MIVFIIIIIVRFIFSLWDNQNIEHTKVGPRAGEYLVAWICDGFDRFHGSDATYFDAVMWRDVLLSEGIYVERITHIFFFVYLSEIISEKI